MIIQNLPIEIVLNILTNIYIIDDLINLYKSNKFFKVIIDTHKHIILSTLFKSKSFSNSYYNLFYSFVNNRYEHIKDEPFLHLKQLLEWNCDKININDNLIANENDNYTTSIKFAKQQLIKYITTPNKIFEDNNLELFRDFLHLLYIPSYYIYDSSILLYTYFNIKGLANIRNRDTVIINLKKKLYYTDIKHNNDKFYLIDYCFKQYPDLVTQITIFEYLLNLYPNILIYHILNFQMITNTKNFKRFLHSIILNLFLEWLFENECKFIEKIFSKLYYHFPDFMQKTIYKLIYNDFNTYYDVFTDNFVDEFFELHRIYLPISKISKLYNLLELNKYKEFRANKILDWKRHLKRLEIFNEN